MNIHIRIVAMLILLGIGMMACAAPPDPGVNAPPNTAAFALPTKGNVVDPPRELTDFSFTGADEELHHLSDMRGKPTLLYFGYTFCPDICPTTLAELTQVRRLLGESADEVGFLFISVDPERDTPSWLATYLSHYDDQFVGGQGDHAILESIAAEYGLYYRKNVTEGTSADYLIDHSTASYLIDQQGRLRMIYSYGTPATVMIEDVRALLNESHEDS